MFFGINDVPSISGSVSLSVRGPTRFAARPPAATSWPTSFARVLLVSCIFLRGSCSSRNRVARVLLENVCLDHVLLKRTA